MYSLAYFDRIFLRFVVYLHYAVKKEGTVDLVPWYIDDANL